MELCGDLSAYRQKIYSGSFTVSNQSNRMGYKMSGETVTPPVRGILSEGITLGAIQVPADGKPIILLNDHQTIGGYPKIGCLSSLGAGQLSQRQPGQIVTFTSMDVADAEIERRLFNRVIFG